MINIVKLVVEGTAALLMARINPKPIKNRNLSRLEIKALKLKPIVGMRYPEKRRGRRALK